MGNVRVGQLYRKRVVKNTNGDIIDLMDEANGGVIVSKGRVVNQERWNEIVKVEEDKKIAAQAIAHAINNPQAPIAERNAAPSKVEDLEKRINGMDDKLNAILAALKK